MSDALYTDTVGVQSKLNLMFNGAHVNKKMILVKFSFLDSLPFKIHIYFFIILCLLNMTQLTEGVGYSLAITHNASLRSFE